ncbi:unnamed protein product, partial [Allacma fusca]
MLSLGKLTIVHFYFPIPAQFAVVVLVAHQLSILTLSFQHRRPPQFGPTCSKSLFSLRLERPLPRLLLPATTAEAAAA